MEIPINIQKELLYQMKRIRGVEETIASRYTEGKMRCPTHLCTGQEAVAAAAGVILSKDDYAVSTHRAHGHYLAKGGSLKGMLAEIYGKEAGCSKGKGGSMHLIDRSAGFMGSTAIVGGTLPIGVGLGLAIQLNQTHQISCIFFGDGATEEGVFYEAVNFAVLKNLPVLFLCENNFYSVYSPLAVRQPKDRHIYKMVQAIGIPCGQGDGNNPVETYHMISEATQSIRQGNGPQFLELFTYRWREHCGPNFDNDLGYRTEKEYLDWKKRDPIPYLENYLIGQQMINSEEIEQMENEIKTEIEEAFLFAENTPFPGPDEAFTALYSEE